MSSEIDFNGIVKRIAGSFQKNVLIELFAAPEVADWVGLPPASLVFPATGTWDRLETVLPCKLLSIGLGGYSVNFAAFDASYVNKLRSGDAPTEQHFITYFSELILLKLRSRLRNQEQIEDVKQETFSRTFSLIRSEGGLRHAERLGPLVNSICNNVLMEQYRSSNRIESLEDEIAERLVETRPNALSRVISDDTRKVVRRVLDGLNERDRSLLQAVFLEERDKDEVCTELGVDRDYLRVLLHRAKASFRVKYSKQAGAKKSDWVFG